MLTRKEAHKFLKNVHFPGNVFIVVLTPSPAHLSLPTWSMCQYSLSVICECDSIYCVCGLCSLQSWPYLIGPTPYGYLLSMLALIAQSFAFKSTLSGGHYF